MALLKIAIKSSHWIVLYTNTYIMEAAAVHDSYCKRKLRHIENACCVAVCLQSSLINVDLSKLYQNKVF